MSHVESELLAFLDGELSPAERQSVEAHLALCPVCRTILAELTVMAAGMAETVPAVYESVHLPAEAEARIRSALSSERTRLSRQSSFQQGLASLWAGLLGAGRPLSKTAIPLMALFFVVLSVNFARLPVQIGTQQTVVLGQDTFAPGSQAAVRVVVRDTASDQPVANANVAVELRQAGLAKTVYSGNTDATGSAPVQFAVPADWQGSAELVVNTSSDLGNDQLAAPIQLERSYRLLLSSDKPVYQPGETLYARVLALGNVDGKPATDETVRFEVIDPMGQVLLAEERTASDFGIASIELPLPDNAALGQHQVRASLDDTVSELTVTLGQAPLPAFGVDVVPDAPYYLPGDRLTGSVRAGYFYGKPVAGAPVNVKVVGSKLGADPSATDQVVFFEEQSGETDDGGTFAFQFDLPGLPPDAFADDDTIQLALEATVVDSAGNNEFGWQKTTLASQPILITVVAEDGVLHTGVENILYVLTSYPDGRPAPTSLEVQIGSAAPIAQVTNDYGLAEIRFTPRSGAEGDRQVSVTAADAAGRLGRAIVALPLDEAIETLLLRTDKALYQVGDTLAVEAIASGGDAVYLDVVKGGQTLLTTSGLIVEGTTTFGIDLTPELAGALELNAYQVGGEGAILRDTRAIVVDAPEDLQVEIAADKVEYRPGDEAQITVHTTRSGEGIESALSLSVVNEAVYAQREYQPGFARAYFLLGKDLEDVGIDLSGVAPATPGADRLTATRAAQQLTAKASWAGYSGQDYSLVVRSTDDDSRNNVNTERQLAFSRLSLWIGVGLILATVIIAIVVISGLRRSGVLGKAANRLLLTVVVLAIVGAGLLFLTKTALTALPEPLAGVALAITSLLWLALLVMLFAHGLRAQDQRVQYVALWLFAYAVLFALLAFAASQGATLASIWLILLAVSFGLLLATLLLFGWGLRAEGEKTAGMLALLLALLVLPLIVAINEVDLGESDVIERISAPAVYGLNGGVLVGCVAPAAAPQAFQEQSAASQSRESEVSAATPYIESAGGEAVATVVGETQPAVAAFEARQAAPQPAVAATPTAEELPSAPAPEETPFEPTPTLQTEGVVETLALAETMTTSMPVLAVAAPLTATDWISSSLEVTGAVALSKTIAPDAIAATAPVTASAFVTGVESPLPIAASPAPTATVAVTSTLLSALEIRAVETPVATGTSVTPGNVEDAAAAAALSGTPLSPTATPTVEPGSEPAFSETVPTATAEPTRPPVLDTPTATPEPTLVTLAATPTPEPVVDTPVPTPEPTVTSTVEPLEVPTPTPQVRVRQVPRPASLPLEALPIIRERFPQTLYWNPEVPTDANGQAQVIIPTGDTITTWRVTAQAVDRNGKLGSTTAALTVFQPLFLVPSIPTELALGEEATGQVQIYNYGSQAQTVILTSHSTPGLQLSQSEFRIVLAANDAVSVPVVLRATQAGAQTATWVAIGDAAQDARQVTIIVK